MKQLTRVNYLNMEWNKTISEMLIINGKDERNL